VCERRYLSNILRCLASAALAVAFLLPIAAAALEPGQAAPAFEVGYADSKLLRLSDLAGSVVVMTLESRDTTGINQPFKDALLKAFPADERLRRRIVVVPVIACFQYPWFAKGFCARGVQDSVRKVNLQLYVDMTGDVFRDYGAREDTSTVVVIDRTATVRHSTSGSIPEEEIPKLIDRISRLAQ